MIQHAHRRIDDIEALRAFAVLFTVIEHVRYVLSWGNHYVYIFDLFFSATTGVDLFLCISGFVIARSLLRTLDSASDNETFWRRVFAFWVRRVFRIWPTSIFWVTAIVACGVIFRHAGYFGHFRENLADFAAVVTQTANFHMVGCLPRSECGNAGPWWSLSLEEQFYILLPFAAFLFRRKIAYFMVLVVVAQIFLHRPSWTYGWVFRTDALALGVLLAIFANTKLREAVNPKFLANRLYAIPIVAVLLVLMASMPDAARKISSVPFSTGMVAIIASVLVFIASFDGDYIAKGPIAKTVLLWIGSRSYSIYLIHWFSIQATKTIWWFVEPARTVFDGRYTLRYLLVWIALTVILSELNYRLLETPLRRKGADIARRIGNGESADRPASPTSISEHSANEASAASA
ncbi:hypothetical protein AYM40_03175 [Paraburkholderia phytofirmans OLGA172]|uniref:Acyltransferase 3 domain-containing protein n=1 Tax=Paraburkholderia phytofirmans OLGA172 TaxID=1417228 RepID=A0A160FH70_9BURK|nr:acyltransferase [Paraburkholderia phytofirmans]ANB71480.1 hypothetical protein AYM40_03175 [Paraburkholderia phytofirmans OLGA172]